MQLLTITLDKDIEKPLTEQEVIANAISKIGNMTADDSFFMEGWDEKRASTFIRQISAAKGPSLEAFVVEQDSVYLVAGIRFYLRQDKVAKGKPKKAPEPIVRDADGTLYYYDPLSIKVYVVPKGADLGEVPSSATEISRAQYVEYSEMGDDKRPIIKTLVAPEEDEPVVFYYLHNTHQLPFALNRELAEADAQGDITPLSKEQYEQLVSEQPTRYWLFQEKGVVKKTSASAFGVFEPERQLAAFTDGLVEIDETMYERLLGKMPSENSWLLDKHGNAFFYSLKLNAPRVVEGDKIAKAIELGWPRWTMAEYKQYLKEKAEADSDL